MLADVPLDSPAYTEEVFGPVAPVVRVRLGRRRDRGWPRDTPYGLSLGILTRDVMRGLEIAEQIPSGLVHINDQTINDEATIPFGGVERLRHRRPARRHRRPTWRRSPTPSG